MSDVEYSRYKFPFYVVLLTWAIVSFFWFSPANSLVSKRSKASLLSPFWPVLALEFDSSREGLLLVGLLVGVLATMFFAGLRFGEKLVGKALCLISVLLWFAIGVLLILAQASASV